MTYRNKKITNFLDSKIREIAKSHLIIDIGGGEPFQKWLKPYKDLFKDCDYRSMDNDASTHPDIVGDIHKIPLSDNLVDGIICASVLEHIENPHKAISEMYRILKPGGKIFIYVPSIYPYHARKGHYPDYWRFFDDTLTVLFKDFSKVELQKRGGYFLAISMFSPIQGAFRPFLDFLACGLDKLFGTDRRNTTAGYYLYAVK